MRRPLILLSLLFAVLLLAACARPWKHPDYTTDAQIRLNYDKDSTACTVQASDKYPYDKEAQDTEFTQCMEKKGWTRSEPFNLLRD